MVIWKRILFYWRFYLCSLLGTATNALFHCLLSGTTYALQLLRYALLPDELPCPASYCLPLVLTPRSSRRIQPTRKRSPSGKVPFALRAKGQSSPSLLLMRQECHNCIGHTGRGGPVLLLPHWPKKYSQMQFTMTSVHYSVAPSCGSIGFQICSVRVPYVAC